MTLPRHHPVADQAEPLGTLFTRLIEEGKRFARAEVDYYKQLSLLRLNEAKTGVILVVVAIFLAQSALTALLIGLGLALARWLGPAGGVIVVAVAGFVVAGLLARSAIARFSVAGAPEETVAEARSEAK